MGNLLKKFVKKIKDFFFVIDLLDYSTNTSFSLIRPDFTERVAEILRTQPNENPIKLMMDPKLLFRMDRLGKERYLTETVLAYEKARRELLKL